MNHSYIFIKDFPPTDFVTGDIINQSNKQGYSDQIKRSMTVFKPSFSPIELALMISTGIIEELVNEVENVIIPTCEQNQEL